MSDFHSTPPSASAGSLGLFPVDWCRTQFPALARQFAGQPAIFFDGPAGSQVPECVIDAIGAYLRNSNANHGGLFATSRESDALLETAHQALADLFGTADPTSIIFGANMTTLTFSLSRALARTWDAGDEIVVTRLDHDANVTPWVLAARDAGATVHHLAIHPRDCTLDLDDLRRKLSPRTRLVAVGAASNAVGTINPIAEICRLAHAVGAEVYVDAVHAAPHLLPDVAAWNCDWLVASAYKFFGPHVGVLWGRPDRLAHLEAYKLRPAPDSLPGKWMTGTQNHECLAGALAAIDYLAALGRKMSPQAAGRRQALSAAYAAIGDYERLLAGRLLTGLSKLPGVQVFGIADPARLAERVPTFGIRHAKRRPDALAEWLAARGIFAWHGNFYALPLTEALGLEPEGLVRIGLLHYNTIAEVDRLLSALSDLET
ncbi:MAG TPA: cysteine desulfurase-like protein [Planctomycetaceae bacterium]|jgi:cysteine desulfurase family protein (TIGR01976 family)